MSVNSQIYNGYRYNLYHTRHEYNRADPLFQAFSQGIWEFFSKKDKLIKTPHFASRPDRYYVKMKTVRIKY